MRITLLAFIFGIFSLSSFAAGSGGGGIPSSAGTGNSQQLSPEKLAAKNYKNGINAKERAWKYEGKAEAATKEKKRAKYLEKAQKQYKKAIDLQAQVLRINPAHYQAANELGYALRKTGEFKKAIGAYSFALQQKPDFFEAIEYRGEAFLGMGLLKESQDAYIYLFRRSPELAEMLLQAMEKWVAGEGNKEQFEFSEWVTERRMLAGAVQKLSLSNTTWN